MKILCNYPFTHFEVNNPNGDVTFCCNHKMVLGNVNRNSIEEIWNGAAYKNIRRKFLEGRIFEICHERCPVLHGWKDYEKLDWYKGLPKDSEIYKNAVRNEEEISGGKVELTSRPRWLRFSTSYACNLKCYHCFQRSDREEMLRLPGNFFEDIKRHLHRAQIIFFYGGEPLIERSNLKLMEYMAQNKFHVKVFLISNGTILNDSIKSILEKLNLSLMDISVDSTDKDLYEELRYPARWPETLEHIRFFSELMKKKGGNLFISLTINKKNENELVNFIKFARELSAMPFFQFAHNLSKDASFRKNYEILSIKEHKEARDCLLKARASLRLGDPPLTCKNIDYLLAYTNDRMSAVKRLRSVLAEKFPGVKNILKGALKW